MTVPVTRWPSSAATRSRSQSMASLSAARDESQLAPAEAALLELADTGRRDALSLSDKETLTLQLYDQILEQELEKALLEQGARVN